jgi:RHS repeat-associated protein
MSMRASSPLRRLAAKYRAILSVEALEERSSPTDLGRAAFARFLVDPADLRLLSEPARAVAPPVSPLFGLDSLFHQQEPGLTVSPPTTGGDSTTGPASHDADPGPTRGDASSDDDSLFAAALDGNDFLPGASGGSGAMPRDSAGAPGAGGNAAREAGSGGGAAPTAGGAADPTSSPPAALPGDFNLDQSPGGAAGRRAPKAPARQSPTPGGSAGTRAAGPSSPSGAADPSLKGSPTGGAVRPALLSPSHPASGPALLVVGPDAGSSPLVKVLDPATGQVKLSFFAYNNTFRGGVRVAVATINGTQDIITAPGPGGGSQIRVFNGTTGNPLPGTLGSFNAFPQGFTDGAYVAAGDLLGDGQTEIVVGTDQGSTAPQVNVFSGADGHLLFSLQADVPTFHGGVRVAAADVSGAGHDDIVTADGPGGAPRVCVFDGLTHQEFYDFLAYDPAFTGGVYVAAGDLMGDGHADIITGPGAGTVPWVRAFAGRDTSPIGSFLAYDPSFAGGVRVAAADLDGDGHADIITGTGPGGGTVRTFNGLGLVPMQSLTPYGNTFTGGLFVAASSAAPVGDPPILYVNSVSGPEPFTGTATLNGIVGLSGTSTQTVTVQYSTFDNTAFAGTDYVASSGTVTFPPGAMSEPISITIRFDNDNDPPGNTESFGVMLSNPTGGAVIGTQSAQWAIFAPGGGGGTVLPPPIVPAGGCGCGGGGELVKTEAGQGQTGAGSTSPAGVRYADGTVAVASTDLSSSGFGTPWGQSRAWTNGPGYADTTFSGNGMVTAQQPYLLSGSNGTVVEVGNAKTARYFDSNGSGGYTPRYFGQEALSYNSTAGQFTLTDTSGDVLTFEDFGSGRPANQRGQLASFTDPDGNVTQVTSWNSSGQPAEVQRSNTTGGVTTVESYLDSYLTSGANAGRLSNVTLRRQVNGGAWSTVRQAAYSYYDGTTGNGNLGDLRTAVVQDASGNALDTTYYRYYTSNSSPGYQGGLKYVLGPQSYARLVAALGSNVDSLTDAQIAPYADDNFQYDSAHRVTEAVVQGLGCSSCSGGQGTFTYSYTVGTFANGYNTWATKTVETLPDGNQNIVYENFAGEVMLSVYHDTTSGLSWETFNEYDNSGRLILTANPSAVTGYDDTRPDLLNNQGSGYQYLSNTSGLIQTTDYYQTTTATATTAGGVLGYVQDTKIQQGQQGTPILQSQMQYFQQTAGGATVNPLATSTMYRNTDGSGAETTSYSYTWFSGTTQIQSMTVSAPVISAAQNGPGTADVTTSFFDTYGRPVWQKDADGFLAYTAYDQATSAVTTSISDVDTTKTGEFTNLPSGWSTPSGGGLNLVTTMQVDYLGRTTKLVDPNGNITYTVYNDPNYEMLTYPGWNSSTNMPTGPTQVTREDRPGSYVETFTMTATPHLTGGVPDGTEAISNVQTLSRSLTNNAGQLVEVDQYFNLSGVTYSTTPHLGTSGTNYYATLYGYDDRGRPDRVQAPTGTITRTVYDGLSRVVSTWVGTNDTPPTGEWSPSNNTSPANMVQVAGNVYDGGGVGDSNLTQQTQYPGGSAANRVTNNYFDWRDRLVASKSGVQANENDGTHRPITFNTYDNLSEVTETQAYDGDGVTITVTNGQPQAPSASLLRAQTVTSFDDQGRAYRTQTYSVDPTTGTVSASALTTNDYYNHRGALIEQSVPGGLVTKTAYDGAGRPTVVYTTDGGSGTSWSAAGSASGDNVLQQVEYTLDADGHAILTTTRQRFHNETATGALGNPTTSPKARVSYVADYYDLANRPIAEVNVGTNGGTAYTRPATVPAPSDTVLVSSTAYTPAGFVDSTTDPRGLVTKDFYDNLGRVTKAVQAYDGGSETNNTDVATEYTYDGDSNTLTIQADLPGGAYQRTQYVYGVTTATGSGVNSNDILAATQYPDPTTGNPSSSQQETYTADALGETLTKADRNGNVHTYSYDVLGRQTADAVTTLGAGVDGSVRRIQTAYDSQGNAYLITSYDAASGGNIVNQVERLFNGLGQLTAEYQSHSGAVVIGTTAVVQYGYSLMAGGANNSRLTSITYPNGRVLNYNYNAGLDSTISRLSSLSDSTGTLQSYSYLGLSTVVIMTDPQASTQLTYVKQTGDTHANTDGGDQYTGLDRFGRVIDQFWLNTSTGTATDRFQYGYDRDGNVLFKNNLVNGTFSELYHTNGSGNGYDNLNQLVAFARGTLNGTNDTISSPTTSESWSLDALGNWSSVTSDGSTQTRTANAQNQITSISGLTTPGYDANGNTTTDQTGKTLVYDAWNRLVAYKSGNTTVETMVYDGLNRRIVTSAGTATDLYYSSAWQVLEERVGGTTQAQYVWSPAYTDALVERDRGPERLYAQQDANWNVTALADTTGTVQERYVYDPYGQVTILAPGWEARGSSSFAWIYLHQSGRFDGITGLYNFRNRDYSSALGRWISLDPLGSAGGGSNLYLYLGDSTLGHIDPQGLQSLPPTGITINSDQIFLGKCGKFAWPVSFKLNRKADAGGWLIQEVQMGSDVTFCDGAVCEDPKYPPRRYDFLNRTSWVHYLEAWYVPPGEQVPVTPSNDSFVDLMRGIAKGFPKTGWNDVFWNLNLGAGAHGGTGTKGSIAFVGDLYFVYGLPEKDGLPKGFKKGYGSEPWGPLWGMIIPPGKKVTDYFPLSKITAFADHNLTVWWNCCPGSKHQTTEVVKSSPEIPK